MLNGHSTGGYLPTIAARGKHRLGNKNPYTVAYDIPLAALAGVHGMTMLISISSPAM
jgi:hypothetical protein